MDATLRCNTKHALQTPHSLPCFFAGPLPRGDCDLHSGQTSCSVGQPSFGVHAVLPHDQALSTRCWWEHGCSGPLGTSHPGACDVGLVMLVSSRFLHFHVTLLPYLTVKWLLRRYSKVIGHWGLIPHQLLPTSLSLHPRWLSGTCRLCHSCQHFSFWAYWLPSCRRQCLPCPDSHLLIHPRTQTFLCLMTCILLWSFFVLMPKLSLIWPLGVALCMFLWPLARSQHPASSPLLPGNIGLSWSLPGVSRSFKDLWYLLVEGGV